MSYPIPTHSDSINAIDGCYGRAEELGVEIDKVRNLVYEAILKYAGEHYYITAKHGHDLTFRLDSRIYVMQSPDDILITMYGNTRQLGSFATCRSPEVWTIELSSFKTPVDTEKAKLEGVIEKALKEIKLTP
ncbi:hypothetical protein H6503_03830 [Candidatus Woesearchaeota archaeon]|nr:hypothetical protein [Candidatus Woesearchaeota archaeon]